MPPTIVVLPNIDEASSTDPILKSIRRICISEMPDSMSDILNLTPDVCMFPSFSKIRLRIKVRSPASKPPKVSVPADVRSVDRVANRFPDTQ